MKKDFIFAPILLLVGAALFLFRFTGTPAHIAISVVGLALLIVYTVLTKKTWKIPALEIVMRVFYGLALITGVVVMRIEDVLALEVAHKSCATLFMALVVALLVTKITATKKQ